MDESERLCTELEDVEAALVKAREKKLKALDDPATLSLIMRLFAGKQFLEETDPEISHLRAVVEEKKKEIALPEVELLARKRKSSRN